MSIYGYFLNKFHSDPQKEPGFKMPSFLSKRAISEYDAPELQQLFIHNNIIYFRELTDEMLRSFLKYSYPKAIYVIELLGLYGVQFLSEKTKRYSEPHTNDYRLLKFERETTEIVVKYRAKYEEEIIGLKRYLSDMRLSTSFLLDGIKLDVLLNRLNLSEDVFKEIFSYEIYPEDALDEIYPTFKEKSFHTLLEKKELEEDQQEVSFSDETAASLEEVCFSDDQTDPDNSQETVFAETNIQNLSIKDLNLSVRSFNALTHFGVSTLSELLSLSKTDLMNIPHLGKKSVQESLEIRNNYSLSFEETDESFSQEIPSYIANIKLPRPDFSVRLSNALMNHNITSIKELLQFSKEELLKIPNFGRTSLKELEEYLKSENVFLDIPYLVVEKEPPQEKSSENFDLLFRQIQNLERKLGDEDRKKDVYEARIKNKEKITLQKLAEDYSVTRERIRQLEVKILKNLEKIVQDCMDSFTSVFEKYGSLISYRDVDEFKLLKDYDVVLKNAFEYKEEFPFSIDLTLELLTLKDFGFEDILFDGDCSACISYSEIENEIRQRISLLLKRDTQETEVNFNQTLQKIVRFNIENNFVFDEKRNAYLSKTSSRDTERIELAFKELYPSGIHIFQNIDDIYEKLKSHDPMIECSSKRAIEARLVNNERIILTNRGFYQHIDTIKVDNNVIAFAAEECKKKLQREEIPFQISIIFEENKAFFERNGVFSEYLLFSLLKRFDDPFLLLRRLHVYKKSEELIKISDYFDEYFKSHKGIVPLEEAENHFISLGWDSFRISNQVIGSPNVFKISSGYFHKDNLSFNQESFSRLMKKIHADINECGFASLEEIRKKNFVDWLGVLNQEDLDARSMVSIIKAFCPEFPYELNSTGVISNGNKLNSSEVLYQWITQKCEKDSFVAATEIMDFCDEKEFHRYNTKKPIKDRLAEVATDCVVSYDYLGLSKEEAQRVVDRIMDLLKEVSSPYMKMSDLIEKLDLPPLNHENWSEFIIRSIIENVGGIVFYGFIVINPYQQKITRRDQVVAFELNNFTHSWFMETDKLERLLRREKVFGKNETFAHKSIQNELFGEESCLEKRDQDKNVCIKQEYRDLFEWQNLEN